MGQRQVTAPVGVSMMHRGLMRQRQEKQNRLRPERALHFFAELLLFRTVEKGRDEVQTHLHGIVRPEVSCLATTYFAPTVSLTPISGTVLPTTAAI
jgi:hypothetical protein